MKYLNNLIGLIDDDIVEGEMQDQVDAEWDGSDSWDFLNQSEADEG